nr:RecName: Full=Pregnancy-associated glycoprotein 66e; AltName: Full=ovPAG 66e [Ovis aries]
RDSNVTILPLRNMKD